MTQERENRPAGNEAASTTTADTDQYTCHTGKCPAGLPCTCEFYAGWTVDWPSHHTEPVSVQLQRRRLASYRCPRLDSGRRDPISQSAL